MADDWNEQYGSQELWHSGKVTRRRLVGWGAGALGATILVPPPWQAAFGQAKPYKLGTIQPLSGAGAAGGKTALVGVEMAVDRINKSGGINGRPIELVVADDESKPAARRRTWSTTTRSTCRSAAFSPTYASPACRFGKKPRSST